MKKRLMLLLTCLFVGIALVTAQNQKVTGTVYSESDGQPVIGASVLVKGTTLGTVTDIDGKFVLNVPTSSRVLKISFVGMETKEEIVKSVMKIMLVSTDNKLDEVVVTAYGGSMKKSSLSGASSRIKGDQLNNQPVQSFDQAMAGKMAGVQVTQSSGLLADGVSIRVRGTNSVSLSSQPLVVIDGVPVTETSNVNVFNGGEGTRFNPMATINPNDIESMEVLKDASASALFGSRAANGVLLITTKRGKEGKPVVSYNGYYGVSKAIRLPDLLGAQDFIDISNEKSANRWGSVAKIAAWDDNKTETDWLKEAFRTGVTQNHSVSVSGGTGKISMYGSADWTKQEGTVIGNSLQRGSVRLNADVKANDWLKVGVSANYSSTENNGVLSDGYLAGVTVSAYNALPNVPVYNADGDYNLSNGLLDPGKNLYSYNGVKTYGNAFYHPVATIELQRNKNTTDRLLANIYGEITPLKGLKITTKVNVDRMSNFEDQYSHPKINGLGSSKGGMVQDNTAWIKQWNWQNYANYDFKVKDHSINLMAGMEYQKREYKDVYAGANKFVFDTYQDILDGLFTESSAGGTMNSRGLSSYFSRLNYNYNNRYFFEASFRTDAYSGFGKDSRWGTFPGFSAAWRMKDESFLKDVDFLSDLKLRGSWGIVGNSNVEPYASRTLYAGGQYANINGVSMSQVGNAALKWEQVAKMDIGVDASFLTGRLNVGFDLWRTEVKDMILDAPVIHIAGIPDSKITTNIGAMWNQGIELQLNSTNIITKEFTWSSSFNLTTVKNKVTKLAGSDILGTNSAIVGEALGVWRVYRYAGVDPATGRAGYYDSADRIKYYDPNPATPTAEKWKFADGTIAPARGTSDLSVQSGKTGTPTWYGNLDNSFRYKGIDLNLGLQFGGGNYILNQTRAGMLTCNLNNNIQEIKERWTTPGQVTDIPKLYHGDAISLTAASTLFLEKADFLRLRDITLGYTLPTSLTSKLGVSMVRMYARGTNLLLWTGYSGSDPEMSTGRNKNISVGIDNRSVPYSQSFTFGLNVNF